ncbi:MAG TPA: hypothetical protein VGI75_09305, partial [Pirellulales bacterium]
VVGGHVVEERGDAADGSVAKGDWRRPLHLLAAIWHNQLITPILERRFMGDGALLAAGKKID